VEVLCLQHAGRAAWSSKDTALGAIFGNLAIPPRVIEVICSRFHGSRRKPAFDQRTIRAHTSDGRLLWDADSAGGAAARLIATLAGGGLVAGDITVIA
jgi:hypothetical protein